MILPGCRPELHRNGDHNLLCFEGSAPGLTTRGNFADDPGKRDYSFLKEFDERDPLDVIAQRLAFEAVAAADPDQADYPDIGDEDWDEIVTRLGVFVSPPDGRTFAHAYDELRRKARR